MTQTSLLPTSVQSAHLPHISIVNGKPITTSLNVAEVFGKQHGHVLRDIERIFTEITEDFRASNFGASSYLSEQNKELPLYNLTFDAFILLVMGYTGKKAIQFKIAYIEEFNRMRNELANTTPTSLTPSTPSDRAVLKKLSDTWARQTGQRYSQCYTQITAYFNLEAFAELPVEWIPDAIAFVQTRLDEHQKALHSAQQKALPPTINLDKEARAYFEKLRDLEEKHTKERDAFYVQAMKPFFHLVYTHEWIYDEISEVLKKTTQKTLAHGRTWEHDTQKAFKLIEQALRLAH